jgi:NDP-sugar pyrophosphorylase family protein
LSKIIKNNLIHKSISFKDTTCHIDNSVIGRNVQLGSEVVIKNCVILDKVVIHDMVTLTDCFVSQRAVIGFGITLKDTDVGY